MEDDNIPDEIENEIENEDEVVLEVAEGGETGIIQQDIVSALTKSYIDYAMSVIVSRALPDVRDGLKPVHRRIIYASHEGDFRGTGVKYYKAARITGDTMGKYHPHGNSAIYEAMVRLTQSFWLNHPLISGQGNWGTRDGDRAAAERYTEARIAPITEYMLHDLKKDTVDWRENYTREFLEPKVLPAKFPNLLVNGQVGIAVAMATNIPTHNLREVIQACLLVLENPETTLDDVLEVMPGPDFPTAGTIMGLGGIRKAYETGNGSIRIAGKYHIEQLKNGKSNIIVTELPYGAKPKTLIERVAELSENKFADGRRELEGVTDIQDESDLKNPLRVRIELKRDIDPHIVVNFLKKKTELVTSFPYNSVVLDAQGLPERMSVMTMLREFVKFRKQVVRRRTIHDLNETRDLLNKQLGLYAAVSMIDEVVALIRRSSNPAVAKTRLMDLQITITDEFRTLLEEVDPDEQYGATLTLTSAQADTILAMRLSKLTSMGLDEIGERVRELSSSIHGFLNILNNIAVLNEVVRLEFDEIQRKFGKDRLTRIDATDYENIDEEDLIENRAIIVTLSKAGYVKYVEVDAFREQKRGGKGRNGMATKDDDFVHTSITCNTKTPIVFFTSRGKAHTIKAYKLPEGDPSSKGRPIVNFIGALRKDETISAIIAMPEREEDLENKSLVFVTDRGDVRRNNIRDFWNIKSNGKNAIDLEDINGLPFATLVTVQMATPEDDLILVTKAGFCIRTPVEDLRVFASRKSTGVRGIKLENGNIVVSASVVQHVEFSPQERDAYQAGGSFTYKNDLGQEVVHVLTGERMAEMKATEDLLLSMSSFGFGKLTSSHEYRVTNRGGKGIMAANINSTTGDLVDCFPVNMEDGLILITDGGQTIRTTVAQMKTYARTARGVRTFKVPDGHKIAQAVRVSADEVPQDEPSEAA
jgi:DNA gyrase subunit A